MGQITLKGDYRSKAFVNLFGWRIMLWRIADRIERSFDVIKETEIQQTIRIPGPVDLTISVERGYASENPYNLVVIAHADGQKGITFYRYIQALPDASLNVPIKFEWNGNAFDGMLFFKAGSVR